MISRLAILLLSLISGPRVFADVDFSNISLSIPRGTDRQMDLSFGLTNVPAEDLSAASNDGAELLIIQKLDVCLVSVSGLETSEDETQSTAIMERAQWRRNLFRRSKSLLHRVLINKPEAQ